MVQMVSGVTRWCSHLLSTWSSTSALNLKVIYTGDEAAFVSSSHSGIFSRHLFLLGTLIFVERLLESIECKLQNCGYTSCKKYFWGSMSLLTPHYPGFKRAGSVVVSIFVRGEGLNLFS